MLAVMFLGLLLAADGGDVPVPRATVVLREQVALDTPEIGLSQVATLGGPADALIALEQVSLGSAPVPGASRTLAVAYIRLRLKRYGVDPGSVDISGDKVTVQRAVTAPCPATAPEPVSSPAVAVSPAAPEVRRNDDVRVAVQCRGVTVALMGRALQDGHPGDTVKVQVPQTNRTVEALVIGPGRLALQL